MGREGERWVFADVTAPDGRVLPVSVEATAWTEMDAPTFSNVAQVECSLQIYGMKAGAPPAPVKVSKAELDRWKATAGKALSEPKITTRSGSRAIIEIIREYRYEVKPGEWEGVHAHPGNQLYVHVKGGRWAVRTGGRENVSTSKTGSIGWYHAIPLSEQHQSGNAGDEPIDLIWVTLKH